MAYIPSYKNSIKGIDGCACLPVAFIIFAMIASMIAFLIITPIKYYLDAEKTAATYHSYIKHYFELPTYLYERGVFKYEEVYADGCSYIREGDYWYDHFWVDVKGHRLEDTTSIKHPFTVHPLKYYQPIDKSIRYE